MQGRLVIQEELKQVAPGIPAHLGCPLQVPQGYFQHFPVWVAAAATTTQAGPMQVPAGYFDTFATQLLQKIKTEAIAEDTQAYEQDELPAVLQGIERTMPHYVPQGYFAELPQAIVQQVMPAPARVVPLRGKVQLWWAAAASVIIAIAVWALQWGSSTEAVPAYATSQPAIEALDASALAAYLEGYPNEEANFAWYLMQDVEAMEQNIESIPTELLEAYLASYPSSNGT